MEAVEEGYYKPTTDSEDYQWDPFGKWGSQYRFLFCNRPTFKKLEFANYTDDFKFLAWKALNEERLNRAAKLFQDALNTPADGSSPYFVEEDFEVELMFPEYGWEQIWYLVVGSGMTRE